MNEYEEFKIEEKLKNKKIKCEICKKTVSYSKSYKFRNSKDNTTGYSCNECCKHMIYCKECGYLHLIKDTHEISTKNVKKNYCLYCYNRVFKVCEGCKKVNHYCSIIKGTDEKLYCTSCFNKRFVFCYRCQKVYWKDDVRFDEVTKQYFCTDCWIKMKFINDYAYNPQYKFHKCVKETPEVLFMGLELEVEHDNPLGVKAKAFMEYLEKINLKNHFYLKNDSSVDGFEIVTHPFSLKYIKSFMRMNEILSYLEKKKFRATYNCGLHVHVNKKLISADDIYKLRLFIAKYCGNIFKMSGRVIFENTFCKYEDYGELLDRKYLLDGRHWAFNTNTNKNTVEFRMFNSTLKYEIFLAVLEFASGLTLFIKNISFNDIKSKNVWDLFCKYIKKDKNYLNIYSLLKEKKLCA